MQNQPDRKWEGDRTTNRTERDVAADGNGGNEQNRDTGEGEGREIRKRTGKTCNRLAAFELHERREAVAEHDGQSCRRHDHRVAFSEAIGQPNGESALEDVQGERQQPGQLAGGPQDVRRTHVSAAKLSYILTGAPADNPGTEGQAA